MIPHKKKRISPSQCPSSYSHSHSIDRRISLHARLVLLSKTLGLAILIHAGGIHDINQRLAKRATELPLVGHTLDIALLEVQLFRGRGQLLLAAARLAVFHARHRVSPRGAEAHARLRRQRSGQVGGCRGQERRGLGACDGGVVASLERIESHLLDHGWGDLDRLGRVPDTQIGLRAADLRGVAGAGDVAFAVFCGGGCFLKRGEGLQAVAAEAGVAVLKAGETVVVLRAVGLAGAEVHGCRGFGDGVQGEGVGCVGATGVFVIGDGLGRGGVKG